MTLLSPPKIEPRTGMTFVDLNALYPSDYLYELLGGELVVLAAPDGPHAATVVGFIYVLHDAQRAGYGYMRTAPCAVAFDYAERGMQARDVPQTDVFFVLAARRRILGRRCVEGRPDLVIEVLSPTTRRDDLPGGRKFGIYERYGVPHYWAADPYARTITQFAWENGGFGAPVVLREGDTLTCPLFPDLAWPVERVFEGMVETGDA
jgi:Uma2 family endonuclease